MWSILRATVGRLGLEMVEVSDPARLMEASPALGVSSRGLQWCWVMTYPDGPPSVAHRPVPRDDETMYRAMCWSMAMLIGDVVYNWGELMDPVFPERFHVPSTARGHMSCLHQFASALLLTEPECPRDFGCDCNRIRAMLSAAPDDHIQATDALLLSDLRAEVARQQALERARRNGHRGVRVARVDGEGWELPSSGSWPAAGEGDGTAS
jgi:hypothetical protein